MFAKDNARMEYICCTPICRESIHSSVNMRFLSLRIMRDNIKGTLRLVLDDTRLWTLIHTIKLVRLCYLPLRWRNLSLETYYSCLSKIRVLRKVTCNIMMHRLILKRFILGNKAFRSISVAFVEGRFPHRSLSLAA